MTESAPADDLFADGRERFIAMRLAQEHRQRDEDSNIAYVEACSDWDNWTAINGAAMLHRIEALESALRVWKTRAEASATHPPADDLVRRLRDPAQGGGPLDLEAAAAIEARDQRIAALEAELDWVAVPREPVAWMYCPRLGDGRTVTFKRWKAPGTWTETPLYAAIAARAGK